jgi:hypothetical protein
LGLIIIGTDITFNTKNKWLYLILWLLKVPSIMLEYYMVFWFWGSNGAYTFISILGSYIAYCVVQLLVLMKCCPSSRVKKTLINAMVFITPIIAVITSFAIADLFGIPITIN